MLKTRFKPIIQLFKQYPWLLLSLLAGLQLAGVLLLSRLSAPTASGSLVGDASRNAANGLTRTESGAAISPAQQPPRAPSPPAKTASKSAVKAAEPARSPATKSKPQSAAGSGAQSATQSAGLTADQQRLNAQYKQSLSSSAASVDTLIEMRVAIAEGVPAVTLGSATEVALLGQDRQPLKSLAAGATYTAQPSAGGITLNGVELPAVILLEPAEGATFNLGERSYRGRLMLGERRRQALGGESGQPAQLPA